MTGFKKFSKNLIDKFVKPAFKKDNSLAFLNVTQFSVVFVDNIFKLVIAFFLIDKIGKEKASQILALVGAIYVIPFLLFSSIGGTLADRFSKQRITIGIKLLEVVIILYSFISFYQGSIFGAYAVLFLLSLESAIFGPSKYGIIADLLPRELVAKGNGLITSFTYLAIIAGTFFGSFLTEITSHHYTTISAILLIFSITGLCFSFYIRYTHPRGSKEKIDYFFLKEIYKTLVYAKKKTHLPLAIASSSFFLFIGAFTQLNIIPYAISEMHLNEVSGGYLFLSTAMGIAIGSLISGRLCKKRINLLIPLNGGFFLSFFLLILKFTTHSIPLTTLALVLLGIFGGMFIVPFDTFIQISSGDEQRGQVIGTTNFFGFVGVLIASFTLYIFSDFLGLSSSSGFFLLGILSFAFSFFLLLRLSDYFLKILSKYFFNPFVSLRYENENLVDKDTIFVTSTANFKNLCLLSHSAKQIFFIVPSQFVKMSKALETLLGCFIIVDKSYPIEKRIELAKSYVQNGASCCIVLENNFALSHFEEKGKIKNLFTKDKMSFVYADFDRKDNEPTTITFSKVN